MEHTEPSKPRHPKGLYVLFFTEMWERFSFYTMFAVFVFYMDEGLKLSNSQVHNTYGFYSGFVYFTPLLGGWLADKFLGGERAVRKNGMNMQVDHFRLPVGTFKRAFPLPRPSVTMPARRGKCCPR